MTGSGADGSRPVAIPVPAVPDKMALPDPMAIADHDQLSAEEHRYIGAARAANTVRGYHSDWTEFATWSASTTSTRYPRRRARSPATSPCSPDTAPRSAP